MGWAGGSHAPRLPAVELKIEVVLPEKDRGKEELSTGGKGSPRAYQGNGAARHFHADERLPRSGRVVVPGLLQVERREPD